MRAIQREFEAHGTIEVHTELHIAEKKQRSLSQNASLHKYCDIVAGKMNDAGFTQRKLVGSFKDGFELLVTGEMIKAIFREVGKALYGKESTKDLSTIEIKEVYRVVDQRFGEVTGCRSEWPSLESQMPQPGVK